MDKGDRPSPCGKALRSWSLVYLCVAGFESLGRENGVEPSRRSVPGPDAYDECGRRGRFTFAFSDVFSLTVQRLVAHADVGRELALDLVAQARAHLGVVDALAQTVLGYVVGTGADFQARLQDQALAERQLVLELAAETHVAVLADE